MFHHIWRLSEPGVGNLGLACNRDGLILGRTPLVERRGGRFVVREQDEISRLLNADAPPDPKKYAGVKTWSAFVRGASKWSITEK
jgi:hypothetical protein